MGGPRVSTQSRAAALVVGWLAVAGAAGAVWMFLAHLGLEIAVLDRFGPGRMLLPVAIGFAIGAALYALVAVGAFRRQRWTWPLGIGVNVLAFLSAAFPYRGAVSAVAMAVSLAAVVVLVSPPGRAAFRTSGRLT